MGKKLVVIVGLLGILFSCKEEIKPTKNKPQIISKVVTPIFNADTAYQFIQSQVDFGPRVPNSEAHANCAVWLENTLMKYGAKTLVQEGEVTAFNGDKLQIKNIIGQFSPEKTSRVLLFAHWDTRPVADKDTEDKDKPIDGANDGGSGVGVILEMARQFSIKAPTVGVDVIFFDAEDYGTFKGSMSTMADDWCLGSQYWGKNPPIENFRPKYGILLDMVGEKNAQFPKEYFSLYFARNVVEKVWSTAQKLGYSNYFINRELSGYQAITDDHRYVNILANIPSIDIISYDPDRNKFGDYHHTHDDNMSVIDKNSLKAVGQTVMEVVYQEK
ncbi:MAG: M28 family peptidase [Flavobacteriales bacterium]